MNVQIFLQNDANQSGRFSKIDFNKNNLNYFVKNKTGEANTYGVRLFINTEICNGCKLCFYECTEKVLNISKTANRKGSFPVIYTGAGCNGCGICVNVCPIEGAIRIFRRVKAK